MSGEFSVGANSRRVTGLLLTAPAAVAVLTSCGQKPEGSTGDEPALGVGSPADCTSHYETKATAADLPDLEQAVKQLYPQQTVKPVRQHRHIVALDTYRHGHVTGSLTVLHTSDSGEWSAALWMQCID